MTTVRGAVKKKEFSLGDYKKTKGIDNVMFKPNEWLELGETFKNELGIPGLLCGGINLLIGHTDSSKTTAMILAAIDAQKKGKLPVFIITEMKWNWEHAKIMGFQYEEVFDTETGELINYDGNFLYNDRLQLKSIEDVAQFINKTLDDQEKGLLPYDLVFLFDSIGAIPAQMSIDKGKVAQEWAALAMSVQFGGSINQRITSSRRVGSPYTNTLIAVNKVWVEKPSMPMAQPKIKPKGGTTMWFDALLVIRFGNVSSSGVNRIKVVKNSKNIHIGSRVNITIEKNHVNGLLTSGKIIVVPTGYIEDSKNAIEQYKKQNIDYFSKLFGENASVDDIKIEIDENDEDVSLDDFMDS